MNFYAPRTEASSPIQAAPMQPAMHKPDCGCAMQSPMRPMPITPVVAAAPMSCGCAMQPAMQKPDCGCAMQHPVRPMPVTTAVSAANMPCCGQNSSQTNPHEACLCNMSLAMSYVLMQSWSQTYEPAVALNRGTIFPELDLPFLAAGRNC